MHHIIACFQHGFVSLYEFMNEDRNFGRRTGSLLESKTDQELVREFRLRKEEIYLVRKIVREDMKCVGGIDHWA